MLQGHPGGGGLKNRVHCPRCSIGLPASHIIDRNEYKMLDARARQHIDYYVGG